MTTRKLHYKNIADTTTTYVGRLGDIWFDPESNVLRTYNSSPGGKTLGSSGSITSTDVTTALGFTPYSNANPSGYTTNTGTVTSVATSGTVSGLTLTGGPITGTGTITLGGTLSLTSTDVTTALGFTPDGNGVYVSPPNFVSVSGTGVVNLSSTSSYNILYMVAAGYTVTLNAPTSPKNGQQCSFSVINNTVTLAVGTGTFVPTFAGALTSGLSYQYTYYSVTSSWYAF